MPNGSNLRMVTPLKRCYTEVIIKLLVNEFLSLRAHRGI